MRKWSARWAGWCAIACLTLSFQALAQNAYPSKPIRVVVPFAPGGATDIMARVVSKRLSEIMGQTLVIDNKPGGNTSLGAELVAKAKAEFKKRLGAEGYKPLLEKDQKPPLDYRLPARKAAGGE